MSVAAWCAGFGRLGGIFGPLIGGSLISAGISSESAFYVFAGIALLSASVGARFGWEYGGIVAGGCLLSFGLWLGFWQLSVQLWFDPFFYSMPSLIWTRTSSKSISMWPCGASS